MSRSTTPSTERPQSSADRVTFAARSRPEPGSDGHALGDEQPRRGLAPTIARWPLDVEADAIAARTRDPAIAIVRQSLADYSAGRAEQASRSWGENITWCVPGRPPVGGQWTGPDDVFAYHALLGRLSDGTFRQRLIAIEGCRGSTVDAYLRTTATRGGQTLDIPSLAIFELVAGRIRRVTELPGDLDAWESFWAE